MKKTLRMLALLLALMILCGAAIPAMAAAKPSIVTETLWAGCEYYSCITFKNMPDDAKVVSIKSSNPKIIQVKVFSDDLYDLFRNRQEHGVRALILGALPKKMCLQEKNFVFQLNFFR